jgi:hypothetical protein
MATSPRPHSQTGTRETAGSRPIDLAGDSPELVAFALLRHLAQLEERAARNDLSRFDRTWLLDAYAECLAAVRGERQVPLGSPKSQASRTMR